MAKKQFHQDKAAPAAVTENQGLPLFVKVGGVVIVLLVVIVAGVAAYQYYTFQKKVNAQVNLPSEPDVLIKQVGSLMELPLDEEPTIATVSDVTKLKDQQFFHSAENGDKVLIYQKAKKAILYRPSTEKIIDVGPVNIDDSEVASASDSAELEGTDTKDTAKNTPVEVSVYNGTKRAGLARNAATKLKSDYELATVVEQSNSLKDYKETIVIDTTGKQKAHADALAKLIGGKAVSFPEGEKKPEGAILIILGDNYKTE